MDTTLTGRSGAVTFQGSPLTLVGPELVVGQPAPAFTLATNDLQQFTLNEALDAGSRAALFIVVPSLDTPTCSVEAMSFQKRVGDLPSGVSPFVVSRDLPFAQTRWSDTNGADKLTYLSDFRERSFGPAYGLEIKELGLLARAVVLVANDGTVAYVQLVKEVASEPDYDAVFAAVAKLP
jgi:thiol peroxidase